jgi:hypothetical protein
MCRMTEGGNLTAELKTRRLPVGLSGLMPGHWSCSHLHCSGIDCAYPGDLERPEFWIILSGSLNQS